MTRTYAVYEMPERGEIGVAPVFVKEGFTWGAFFGGPVWLLRRGILSGVLMYAIYLVLGFMILSLIWGQMPIVWLLLFPAVHVVFGFTVPWVYGRALEAGGYRLASIVVAKDLRSARHWHMMRILQAPVCHEGCRVEEEAEADLFERK